MTVMCQALRSIGVEATSCHFEQGRYQFKPDICLHLEKLSPRERMEKKREFLLEAAQKYDVFHFHFGETFFPDRSDLAFLKNLGKKLVVQHRGSEVRRLSIARKMGNPYVFVKENWRNESKIIDNLKELSKYIDHAIVADHELLPYIKDYYKHVHVIRQVIDPNQFAPVYPSPSKKKPLIVHCPSHRKMKGTKYILDAIKKLKKKKRNKLKFDFLLLENVPHHEVLRAYRQADLVIDQLRIGAFGIASLEGMALGKPVICYIRDGLEKTYPPGLPIYQANPDTIYRAIKKLIKHPEKRKKLGIKGRRYVEQFYNSKEIAKDLLKLYKHL